MHSFLNNNDSYKMNSLFFHVQKPFVCQTFISCLLLMWLTKHQRSHFKWTAPVAFFISSLTNQYISNEKRRAYFPWFLSKTNTFVAVIRRKKKFLANRVFIYWDIIQPRSYRSIQCNTKKTSALFITDI